MAVYNPNYVGGDIVTGAKDIRQLVFGPRTTLNPYRLGIPGMYICSAATPPGPGAHGMCGANAATQALTYLHRGAEGCVLAPRTNHRPKHRLAKTTSARTAARQ